MSQPLQEGYLDSFEAFQASVRALPYSQKHVTAINRKSQRWVRICGYILRVVAISRRVC